MWVTPAEEPRPTLARRSSQAVSCQGFITFPAQACLSTDHDGASPLPSGSLYALLRGRTLHLYERDPFTMPDADAEKASEVATLSLDERGYWSARRLTELGKAGKTFQLVPKGVENKALNKKRSATDLKLLAESTNVDKDEKRSFTDKLALRMRRAKSVSDRSLMLEPILMTLEKASKTEPLTLTTESQSAAEQWVMAINFALATSPSSPLPSPQPLPSPTAITHRRPGTAQAAPNFTFPPTFDSARRPSFLDRPPPSPRSYTTIPLSPPPPSLSSPEESKDVPTWIQAVRHSSIAASTTSSPPPTSPTAPEPSPPPTTLRARRSRSGLGSSTLPARQAPPMERSRSAKSSVSSGGGLENRSVDGVDIGSSRKLLGLFGGKRKKEFDVVPLPTAEMRTTSTSVYSQPTHAASTSSLPGSHPGSLTESQTSAFTDFPATPEFQDDATTSNRSGNGAADSFRMSRTQTRSSSGPSIGSHLSGTDESGSEASHTTTFITLEGEGLDSDSFDSLRYSKQQISKEDWRANFARTMGSTDMGRGPMRLRETSAATLEANSNSLRQSHSSAVEHIVDPNELVAHMREESLRGFSAPTNRRQSRSSIGLSPPPRSMSRQSLSSLANGRSSSKHSLSLDISPGTTPTKGEGDMHRPFTTSLLLDDLDLGLRYEPSQATTPTRSRTALYEESEWDQMEGMTLRESDEDLG